MGKGHRGRYCLVSQDKREMPGLPTNDRNKSSNIEKKNIKAGKTSPGRMVYLPAAQRYQSAVIALLLSVTLSSTAFSARLAS